MGSRTREIKPTITVRMAMTIATMGRRIKKSAITVTPCRVVGLAWRALACRPLGGLSHLRSGFRLHGAPSRTFCRPSVMMRSPAFNPSRMSRFSPIVSPTLTARWLALLSAPMTHTKFLPCSSVTARSGTRMLSGRTPRSTLMRANMPGRSSRSGLGNAARTRSVPVFTSTARSRNTIFPFSGCSEPVARSRVIGRSSAVLPVRRISV